MVKTALNDTYLGGTTPTALKKEVSPFRQMYYDRDKIVMVNQSVNEFYTWFLFKIVALTQGVAFPLDIAATFFRNLSSDVRFFIYQMGSSLPQGLRTMIITRKNRGCFWS